MVKGASGFKRQPRGATRSQVKVDVDLHSDPNLIGKKNKGKTSSATAAAELQQKMQQAMHGAEQAKAREQEAERIAQEAERVAREAKLREQEAERVTREAKLREHHAYEQGRQDAAKGPPPPKEPPRGPPSSATSKMSSTTSWMTTNSEISVSLSLTQMSEVKKKGPEAVRKICTGPMRLYRGKPPKGKGLAYGMRLPTGQIEEDASGKIRLVEGIWMEYFNGEYWNSNGLSHSATRMTDVDPDCFCALEPEMQQHIRELMQAAREKFRASLEQEERPHHVDSAQMKELFRQFAMTNLWSGNDSKSTGSMNMDDPQR